MLKKNGEPIPEIGETYINKQGQTCVRKFATWAEMWENRKQKKGDASKFKNETRTKEQHLEYARRSTESRKSSVSSKEFFTALQPFYEGILKAHLKNEEVRALFVASFYLMVELTKNNKIYVTNIGTMFSKKTYRKTKFRYRFKLNPAPAFKRACDNINLMTLLPAYFVRGRKNIVSRTGSTLVDFGLLEKEGCKLSRKNKSIKIKKI